MTYVIRKVLRIVDKFLRNHRLLRRLFFAWIIALLARPTASFALSPTSYAQELKIVSTGIVNDLDEKLTVEEVYQSKTLNWLPVPHHKLIDGALWMKVVIEGGVAAVHVPFVFVFRESLPTDTAFYAFGPDGRLVNKSHMGAGVPFAEWDLPRLEALHEFTLETPGQYTLIARIKNDPVTFLGFDVLNDFVHEENLQRRSIIFGITLGALAAIFLYNLILWRTLSRIVFLQFSGVIALYFVCAALVSGGLSPILAAISPKLAWIESMVFSMSTGFSLLFWNVFLKRFRFLWSGRLLKVFAFALLANALVAPFDPRLCVHIMVVLGPLSYVMLMTMALTEAFRKQSAGVLLAVGTTPLFLAMFAWHPSLAFLDLSMRELMPMAYIFQIICVGVSLTEGISELRSRLIAALNSRVDAMEKLVKQRTAEVENANKTLKSEISIRRKAEEEAINQSKKIQDAQSQLVSSSRLRALGEMATGISHEINNPLTILKGYLYLIHNAAQADSSLAKIAELCGKAMVTTDRMVNVVKGLREFALQDEKGEASAVNVRKSWEITINLLHEKLANTGVVCHISEIPDDLLVWVRAADFTQSLLSFLNFSIEAAVESDERWLNVKVDASDTVVRIGISHSGKKMEPEFAEQMFTPFFVDMNGSDVRSLGLSIAKQLLTSVGGDIRYVAEAQHTEFEIVLKRVAKVGEDAKESA